MQSDLEIRNSKSESRNKEFQVRELTEPDWKFNREMYFKVGDQWKWIDKRPWSDEQWREYAENPSLRTFAAYSDAKLIGYYELRRTVALPPRSHRSQVTSQTKENLTGHTLHVTCHLQDEIEIAYFGLLPEFIGRGFGGALLASAIQNAWGWAPTPSRVWVHTCNRDHPSALANYLARGFTIYKVELLSERCRARSRTGKCGRSRLIIRFKFRK